MGSEKFCLRWNDFESNISGAFRELRDDKDFFDVTLACDDEQIQAHKMILSACSPFFRNILRRNPHQHPLLYLKGVKYTDLQSVLNFMYHGEVNVAQEELNSFLAVAEDLRVKGLTQNQSESQASNKQSYTQPKSEPPPKSVNRVPDYPQAPPKRPRPPPTNLPSTPMYSTPISHSMADDIQEVVPVKSEPRELPPPPPVAQPPMTVPVEDPYASHEASHTLASVDDDTLAYQDESYEDYGQYEGQQYEGGDGHHPVPAGDANIGQTFQDPSELLQFVRRDPEDKRFYCTICEKFSHKVITLARNHVESQHFPDTFSYPCDICGEVLKTKSNAMLHRSRKHLNKKNMM